MKVFDGGLESIIGAEVYVGIDQSYSGFAITALNETGYRTTVYKSDKRGIERLRDIQAHMLEIIVNYTIIDVAMEGYAFGS